MTLLTTGSLIKQQLAVDAALTEDDTIFDLYAQQASDMVHQICKRQFYATNASTRTYDACPPYAYGFTLYFHEDFLGVDSIVNNGTTLTPDQYRLLPLNTLPKYGAQVKLRSSLYGWQATDGYYQDAITVVGTVGYCTEATRPPSITTIATRLGAWLYNTRNSEGDTVQLANGAIQVPATAPPFVMKMLQLGGFIYDEIWF